MRDCGVVYVVLVSMKMENESSDASKYGENISVRDKQMARDRNIWKYCLKLENETKQQWLRKRSLNLIDAALLRPEAYFSLQSLLSFIRVIKRLENRHLT